MKLFLIRELFYIEVDINGLNTQYLIQQLCKETKRIKSNKYKIFYTNYLLTKFLKRQK